LGWKPKKYDCCEVGCKLYHKDDNHLTECKFFHLSRYFPPKGDKGRYKQIPRKRMFYLPIIPRLQRLYASVESAKQMRWLFENKKRRYCDIHVTGKLGSTLIRYVWILLLTHDMWDLVYVPMGSLLMSKLQHPHILVGLYFLLLIICPQKCVWPNHTCF